MHTSVNGGSLGYKRAPSRPVVQAHQPGPKQQHVVKQQPRLLRTLAVISDSDEVNTIKDDGRDKAGSQLRDRIRRKARAFAGSSTEQNGFVRVGPDTDLGEAASRLAEQLQKTNVVRIIARTITDVPEAVQVILETSELINQPVQPQQHAAAASDEQEQQQQQPPQQTTEHQQAQQQQKAAKTAKNLLVFQPVRVTGKLVVPPELPEHARVLYTYQLPEGNKVYQHAMQQCTQERAAAESQGTRGPSTVGVNASSDVRIAGNCVAKIIKKQGWAELDCSGGALATARGIEAILCARGALGRPGDKKPLDVSAVFLKHWDKQKSEEQLHNSKPDTPSESCRLLVMGCAKNKPAQLVKVA